MTSIACIHGVRGRVCGDCTAEELDLENERLRAEIEQCHTELKRMADAIDNIYGHSDYARGAVVEFYGTCHKPFVHALQTKDTPRVVEGRWEGDTFIFNYDETIKSGEFVVIPAKPESDKDR